MEEFKKSVTWPMLLKTLSGYLWIRGHKSVTVGSVRRLLQAPKEKWWRLMLFRASVPWEQQHRRTLLFLSWMAVLVNSSSCSQLTFIRGKGEGHRKETRVCFSSLQGQVPCRQGKIGAVISNITSRAAGLVDTHYDFGAR